MVQILPYWIYRGGVWFSNSNTLTQGVKFKLKNFSINANNNLNDTSFSGIDNFSMEEIDNTEGFLSENFTLNANQIEEVNFSLINENIII